MSIPCKNCGRNTEISAEPIEWKTHTFCSETCYASYLQSKGVKVKSPRPPRNNKNLIARINDLPTPLKVVVWLNIVLGAITLIESLAYMSGNPTSANIENGFSVLISVLIVVGIIQASRFIRIFVLICSWISVIMIGIGLPFLLIHAGAQAILALIPFLVSVVTIWGLSARRSKAYFGY
jgi:hypothetical protein